jgi:hypothetical protein
MKVNNTNSQIFTKQKKVARSTIKESKATEVARTTVHDIHQKREQNMEQNMEQKGYFFAPLNYIDQEFVGINPFTGLEYTSQEKDFYEKLAERLNNISLNSLEWRS